MKIAKNLMLLGVMGLVAVCLPSIAMGQSTAGDQPAAPAVAPVQPYAAPVQRYEAPANPDGPMDGFTLAPRIGYAYLGGQGATVVSGSGSASGSFVDIHAMKLDLDLNFSGRGGSFELAPFYMLLAPDAPGADKMHALGLDLGFLYSWYISAGPTAIYPGLGFGIGFGPIFNDVFNSTFAMLMFAKLNVSCTFYPSKNVPIGIVFEWGVGMHTDMYYEPAGADGALLVYGFYTDVVLGVRFF
jgi:hypothetical protein